MASEIKFSEKVLFEAKIDKIVEENPDLTYEFIKEIFLAQQEVLAGNVKPYIFEK